jgi:hypothetical protein
MQGGNQKPVQKLEPRQEASFSAKLQFLDEEERRLVETVCALKTKASQYDSNKPLEIAQFQGRHEVALKELEAVQTQRFELVKEIRASA